MLTTAGSESALRQRARSASDMSAGMRVSRVSMRTAPSDSPVIRTFLPNFSDWRCPPELEDTAPRQRLRGSPAEQASCLYQLPAGAVIGRLRARMRNRRLQD